MVKDFGVKADVSTHINHRLIMSLLTLDLVNQVIVDSNPFYYFL